MTTVNVVSSTTHIEVDPANRTVNVVRGGPRGLTGNNGVDGLDGAPIVEGTAVPGDLGNGYFFFDTDDVPNIPAGIVSSGQVAASGNLSPLTTTAQDIPGLTSGNLTLETNDVIFVEGVVDSITQAGVTNIGTLEVNGVEQSAQIIHKSSSGTDREVQGTVWRYVVPSGGTYVLKLRGRQNSGSGGTFGAQHSVMRWRVFRNPLATAGVLKYKKQDGTIVNIAGVGVTGTGGADGEVQYNAAGAFSGAAKLKIVSTVPNFVDFFDTTDIAVPAVPSAGKSRFFTSTRGGRQPAQLVMEAPNGFIMPQHFKPYRWGELFVHGGSILTGGIFSAAPTLFGGGSNGLVSVNLASATMRDRFPGLLSVGTSGGWAQLAQLVPSNGVGFHRGANPKEGGFSYRCRFSFSSSSAGTSDRHVCFVGLLPANSGYTGIGNAVSPTTVTNLIGIYLDSTVATVATLAMNGAWQSITNDGSGTATTASLGLANAVMHDLMELHIWCYPNDTTMYLYLENLTTGVTVAWTLTVDIPDTTAQLMPTIYFDNYAPSTPRLWLYNWRVDHLGL